MLLFKYYYWEFSKKFSVKI